MTTFNPHDWRSRSGWFERPERRRPEELNREAGQRWAMALAFCLCFASLAPGPLFPFALAGLLFVAGLASLGLASLQRQPPFAPHFTPWDEAAWSFVASLALQAWLGQPPM